MAKIVTTELASSSYVVMLLQRLGKFNQLMASVCLCVWFSSHTQTDSLINTSVWSLEKKQNKGGFQLKDREDWIRSATNENKPVRSGRKEKKTNKKTKQSLSDITINREQMREICACASLKTHFALVPCWWMDVKDTMAQCVLQWNRWDVTTAAGD